MDLTSEQHTARAFVRGVDSLRANWRRQPLSELRESVLDVPTRQAIAGLARACATLLDDHPARWTLDALMGLHLEIVPPPAGERGLPPQQNSVNKEQAIDWLDMVCDALNYLYQPPEALPASQPQRRPVVTATLPDEHVVPSPKRSKHPPNR